MQIEINASEQFAEAAIHLLLSWVATGILSPPASSSTIFLRKSQVSTSNNLFQLNPLLKDKKSLRKQFWHRYRPIKLDIHTSPNRKPKAQIRTPSSKTFWRNRPLNFLKKTKPDDSTHSYYLFQLHNPITSLNLAQILPRLHIPKKVSRTQIPPTSLKFDILSQISCSLFLISFKNCFRSKDYSSHVLWIFLARGPWRWNMGNINFST